MTILQHEQLLDLAAAAAEDAGRKILKLFRGAKPLAVRRKYDYPGSIVTNADIVSERIILSQIKRSRIKCTINSEEAGVLDYGSRRVVWALDPLDGTLNYAKRIPWFAVSIGALVEGEPVAGAIYNPVMDELYTASLGIGAHLNGKRIHVSRARSLRNSSLIFEWWEPEPSIPDPLELEKRLYHHTRKVRSPGSVALNLCAVAAGRFDGLVTVFRKSPIYETAAGCLILEQSRGRVSDSLGRNWRGFSRSIVGGGPSVQSKLLSLIGKL